MTFGATFSKRAAQQGRHGFELEASSLAEAREALRARLARSILHRAYLLTPGAKRAFRGVSSRESV